MARFGMWTATTRMISQSLRMASRRRDKPVMILMHTKMGQGVDFMTGSHKWHGKAPSTEQEALALAQLKETLGVFLTH